MRCRSLWITCFVLYVAIDPIGAAPPEGSVITLPKPVTVTLHTRDGVQLICTFYGGGIVEKPRKRGDTTREYVRKDGKRVVPIILLHGWDGQRNEFSSLANVLQRRGHAVMVPDLRGHGESLTRRLPDGKEIQVNRERMKPGDIQGMVLDVEAVKKFLLEKNNEGGVNIDLLCVVGAELGSIIAVNWAERDWNRRQLPTFKQGRDIKALVLLTPMKSYKGLTLTKALQHPAIASQLSIMIVAGQDDRTGFSDAKSIHDFLERQSNEPADGQGQKLFFIDPETTLKGIELVDPRARLFVTPMISSFIHARLVKESTRFMWRERTNPLSQP